MYQVGVEVNSSTFCLLVIDADNKDQAVNIATKKVEESFGLGVSCVISFVGNLPMGVE